MSTLFISDLHLSSERPAISRLFHQFLIEQAPQAEALYILGDLFEVWLGDDLIPPEVQTTIEAIRALSDGGTPVYVMHGNRDFLLGEHFAELSGATLLSDPYELNLYGIPTLLMHGDLLCTDDLSYHEMRKMLRNPKWIKTFLQKDSEQRISFARSLRERSTKETGEKDEAIMDVNADTVKKYVQQYSAKRLIHGHTHRPAIHNDNAVVRYVLGDWYEQGSVLRCDSAGCQLDTL